MAWTGDPRNQSPFNALPPVVAAMTVLIAGIEALFQAGAAGVIGGRAGAAWRLDAIRDWAVFDQVAAWMLETGRFPLGEAARILTYPLIHTGFGHAAFVCVFVLALGNVIAPFYATWRIPAIFWGSAMAGALAYVAIFDAVGPLTGGFTGAYGLIGAFTYLSRRGLTRLDPDRAFLLIGFLLAIQPIFGLASGSGFAWVPNWIAEAAGAAAGYGLASLLFPGGMARLLGRLRQR
ncbi:MAG: rhomboid family intramembrane serine protease [Pseudomonadota bacterium]